MHSTADTPLQRSSDTFTRPPSDVIALSHLQPRYIYFCLPPSPPPSPESVVVVVVAINSFSVDFRRAAELQMRQEIVSLHPFPNSPPSYPPLRVQFP